MANTNAVGNTLAGVTGSGSFVGNTSPTLVSPVLGTPASGDLQNCTVATTTTKGVASFATADFAVSSGAASKRRIAFNANRTTSQSVASSTWTKLQLNTSVYDTDSGLDVATNFRYTVPTGLGGTYSIQFNVICLSLTTAKQLGADIYVNGVSDTRGLLLSVGATTTQYASGSAILYLSAGDYIEVYGWQDSGGALNMQGSFRGIKV